MMTDKVPFLGVLNVFVDKNNVRLVLTDAFKANIIAKKTGGMETKRGTDKNSQKTGINILSQILDIAETKGVNLLEIRARTTGNNKEKSFNNTMKTLIRTLQNQQRENIKILPVYQNSSPISISANRPKGGRRGRRV